jgi:O-antigen/teichoic acid export membrane protein
MSSRTRQAAKGFATDVGGQFVLTLLNFIAAPIILRLTSQSLYGFWILTISVLGYLALTDLGLGLSLTRLVAGLTDKDDPIALNSVISTAFFTFCGAGLVFFSLGIAITPFIPGWFKIPRQEVDTVISAYRIAVVSGSIALPLSVFSGILAGYQKMAISNTVSNLISFIAVGLSLFMLFSGVGLIALPLSSLFTVLTVSSVCYYYVIRCFPQLKIHPLLFNKTDLKRLFSFGSYFQIGRIANTVAVSTDNIVIAGAMSAVQVTPYSFSSKLPIVFSISLASKLPNAVFPAISQMFANHEIEKIRHTFHRLLCYSVRLAVVAGAFIFIVNRQFVSLWVGPQYYGGDLLNAVFVYWVLQDTIYRGTTAIVFASGDLRNWTIASTVEALLNITFSLLLVSSLGLVGVALGTSIGKTLSTGWYTPYWVCRKLELPVKYFLLHSVVLPMLRSLPGVGITFLISVMLPLSLGWLWVIGVGLTSGFTNIFMFEGFMLCKPSSTPWRIRLRQLISFQGDYDSEK